MTHRLFTLVTMLFAVLSVSAQSVKVTWEFSNIDDLAAVTLGGDDAATALVSGSYALGANLKPNATLKTSNADTGYTLGDVLQFAHIAGPIVVHQSLQRLS